ncbi:hypothetical protein EYZ11_012776 [Aspergillus tanneri]|uniref:Uncharacterized protein n=1 Tax=Aspergillus tanneri TaxID=1220188 RepID=A0A4S3IZL8_9EURO|nr:hypothetical protein EYZ11_012776 [Aspergillus tanneri]
MPNLMVVQHATPPSIDNPKREAAQYPHKDSISRLLTTTEFSDTCTCLIVKSSSSGGDNKTVR